MWQDIETAPRDGTRVLVCTPEGYVYIASWASERLWDDENEGGTWMVFDCEDYYYSIALKGERSPTHWMPLPPPPGVWVGLGDK